MVLVECYLTSAHTRHLH